MPYPVLHSTALIELTGKILLSSGPTQIGAVKMRARCEALASPRADWCGDGGEARVARGEVDFASTRLNLVSRYGFG